MISYSKDHFFLIADDTNFDFIPNKKIHLHVLTHVQRHYYEDLAIDDGDFVYELRITVLDHNDGYWKKKKLHHFPRIKSKRVIEKLLWSQNKIFPILLEFGFIGVPRRRQNDETERWIHIAVTFCCSGCSVGSLLRSLTTNNNIINLSMKSISLSYFLQRMPFLVVDSTIVSGFKFNLCEVHVFTKNRILGRFIWIKTLTIFNNVNYTSPNINFIVLKFQVYIRVNSKYLSKSSFLHILENSSKKPTLAMNHWNTHLGGCVATRPNCGVKSPLCRVITGHQRSIFAIVSSLQVSAPRRKLVEFRTQAWIDATDVKGWHVQYACHRAINILCSGT